LSFSLKLYEITTRAFCCPLRNTFVGQNDKLFSWIFLNSPVSFPQENTCIYRTFKMYPWESIIHLTHIKTKLSNFSITWHLCYCCLLLIMAVISYFFDMYTCMWYACDLCVCVCMHVICLCIHVICVLVFSLSQLCFENCLLCFWAVLENSVHYAQDYAGISWLQ